MIRDEFTPRLKELVDEQADLFNTNAPEDRKAAIHRQINEVLEQRKKKNAGV